MKEIVMVGKEIFDLKKVRQLKKDCPNYPAKYFLCNVSAKMMNDTILPGYPEHEKDYWGVFTVQQRGYKMSIEQLPLENDLTEEQTHEALELYKKTLVLQA